MRTAATQVGLALLASGLWSCASAGGGSRSYERAGLNELTVRSLDVVVSISGPPMASPPVFTVPAFDVPRWDSVLRAQQEDAATQDEVVKVLRRRLAQGGYTFRMLHGGQAPAMLTRTQPPIETSTTPVGHSAIREPGSTPGARPEEVAEEQPSRADSEYLAHGRTLRSVLDASEADAVLVIRAVPVDAFYIVETVDQLGAQDSGFGLIAGQAVLQTQSVLRTGRLLVGQAFLFDRKTGLRLWTRQRPDFPDDGRLLSDAKLFDYGVRTPKGGSEMMPADKAAQAAQAFVNAMLKKLPDAHSGTEAARVALATIDPQQEGATQSFLDEGHYVLQLDGSWSAETAGLDVQLGVDAQEPTRETLGTAALAPKGVYRVTPRFGYLSPGGFLFSVGVPLGFAPNAFERTYFRDNPNRNDGDPDDIGTRLTLGQPSQMGLEVSGEYSYILTPTIFLRAGGGLFGDLWTFDASPLGVVSTDKIYRYGGFAQAGVTLRYSDSSPVFLHGTTRGRLGWASVGPVVTGLDLILGLGLFL